MHEYEDGEDADQQKTVNLFNSIQIKELSNEVQSQLHDEFAEYSPERAFTPFEQAFLGYTQHSFVSSQVIHESQYLLCPEFGAVV